MQKWRSALTHIYTPTCATTGDTLRANTHQVLGANRMCSAHSLARAESHDASCSSFGLCFLAENQSRFTHRHASTDLCSNWSTMTVFFVCLSVHSFDDTSVWCVLFEGVLQLIRVYELINFPYRASVCVCLYADLCVSHYKEACPPFWHSSEETVVFVFLEGCQFPAANAGQLCENTTWWDWILNWKLTWKLKSIEIRYLLRGLQSTNEITSLF